MNSLEIQYFLTIVKYGSFTEAAQTLSVSQPAISKQIRQLEAELGCSLFARSGRTLSLTEAGQAYYAYFQQCCFQLDLLKNKLEDQKKDGKSTIRIAYPEDVDPAYFRDKIQSAAAALETPVRLEFSCYPEAELANLLTDGKADLILTGTPPDTTARRFSGDSSSQAVSFQPQSVLPSL
jgi:DNA-binding transcriptional LysR family regulator